MKIKIKKTTATPKKKYPYLAVYKLADLDYDNIEVDDICLISLVKGSTGADVPYVQKINGCKAGFFITKEDNYMPLPKGCVVKFVQ
jgi:hypothetical protein